MHSIISLCKPIVSLLGMIFWLSIVRLTYTDIYWGRLPTLVNYLRYAQAKMPQRKCPTIRMATLRHHHLTELKLERNLSKRTLRSTFKLILYFSLFDLKFKIWIILLVIF